MIHFLNGAFVDDDKLLISPHDLGYTRGYAVADFLVTHSGKPFKLHEHIDRLFKSAETIGLHMAWSKNQITKWVLETLSKNTETSEKTIKIVVSGGPSDTMYQANPPTIVIMIHPYVRLPASYYENGVKVKAVKYQRPYPEAKHTQYIEAIKQLELAKKDGIAEIIYYDDSQVYEGAGSNIFAILNHELVTPQSNIVEGITRNILLETLSLPLPVKTVDFSLDNLMSAEEVFLTGSSKEIRGVVEINGRPIGNGKVGPITKNCAEQYQKYVIKWFQSH